MKVCPTCQRTFDDSQNFCLNDGTPLTAAEVPLESETVVTNRPSVVNAGMSNYEPQPAPSQYTPPVEERPKSRTGLIVALTALVTLLLVGVGVGGFWMLTRNRQTAQVNTNLAKPSPANSNRPANANSAANSNLNSNASVVSPNANSVNNSNANLAPSPTPQPTLSAQESKAVRSEVTSVLDSWKSALESRNLSGHLSYYADSVEYYNSRYNRSQIMSDKQRAFDIYDEIEVNTSNVRVTPDPAGDKATVVYDKEWTFSGEEKTNEGKVQSQLMLQKIGGRWLITGERDLKVYYNRTY